MSILLMPRPLPIPKPKEGMDVISRDGICKYWVPANLTIGGILNPVLIDIICSTIINSRRMLVSGMLKQSVLGQKKWSQFTVVCVLLNPVPEFVAAVS